MEKTNKAREATNKKERGRGDGGQKRKTTEDSSLQVTIFEMLEAKKKKEK